MSKKQLKAITAGLKHHKRVVAAVVGVLANSSATPTEGHRRARSLKITG